ncbi:MAG: hypothetical protein HY555_05460 [Euryarchaeota archaeon]|nr:hypothetical protein [Euryarchaeota archaeon]
MPEDLFNFALTGIYSLLLLSLCFNFLLSIRLHLVDRRVEAIDRRSREEADKMDERMRKVKDELLHRKGYLM